MKKMNLKELEKKAYRSVFQDGLWDVFVGFSWHNLPSPRSLLILDSVIYGAQ